MDIALEEFASGFEVAEIGEVVNTDDEVGLKLFYDFFVIFFAEEDFPFKKGAEDFEKVPEGEVN